MQTLAIIQSINGGTRRSIELEIHEQRNKTVCYGNWKFLGKIVFSDQFLAPQAPKIWTNCGILVKNRPILWKSKLLLHNYAQNDEESRKTTIYRLFFEICSVTTFFKNPVYSVTKPSVIPSSIRALFITKKTHTVEEFFYSKFSESMASLTLLDTRVLGYAQDTRGGGDNVPHPCKSSFFIQTWTS